MQDIAIVRNEDEQQITNDRHSIQDSMQKKPPPVRKCRRQRNNKLDYHKRKQGHRLGMFRQNIGWQVESVATSKTVDTAINIAIDELTTVRAEVDRLY